MLMSIVDEVLHEVWPDIQFHERAMFQHYLTERDDEDDVPCDEEGVRRELVHFESDYVGVRSSFREFVEEYASDTLELSEYVYDFVNWESLSEHLSDEFMTWRMDSGDVAICRRYAF